MPDINDISSSGKVAPQNIRVSDKFTDFSELPSKGHCRLMKAQRYGIWNVLKGLKPEHTADKQFAQMLTKEYSLMVGLNHPNIVRTYGHENVPELGECIIMEYVDGRTLADFVQENPTVAQRKQVTEELLDALAYCHKKQIVHQDLKPSNILITHDGDHVKIIDFGLSDSHEWAILKEPAFTKAYAAPEQLAGEQVDNRTDIYAFGIMLRQLFPKRYGSIIRKCLQPQREKRYSSAEAVIADIQRADSRRKWMPVVAIALTILIGLAIFIGRQFVQKGEQAVRIPKTTATEHNDKDSLPANIKSELDSILKPFIEEVESGKILYKEDFLIHRGITWYKLLIHIHQSRQQLPRYKQNAFMQHAYSLFYDLINNYVEYDSDGNEKYESFESLHKEGKISDDEYDKLREMYAVEESELFSLVNILEKESHKNN